MTDRPTAAPCELVTFGETMALLQPPRPGLLRHADTLTLSVGGAESNVAIGAARLGIRCGWVGRVGDDELGARVVREIRAEGVEVVGIVDPEAATGLMIKERRTRSQTRLSYYRSGSAGSRIRVGDVPEELVRGARVLHLTGITAGLSSTALQLVDATIDVARAAGTAVSVDLNFRRALWTPSEFGATMRRIAGRADLVFGSPQEVAFVVGADVGSPEEQARALARLGPRQCVIKLGAEGAYALVEDRAYRQSPFAVEVVDSVGAGDAFVAGWLAASLRSEQDIRDEPDLRDQQDVNDAHDVQRRLRTAAACGAYACTVAGDWEGAPTPADVDRMIDPSPEGVDR